MQRAIIQINKNNLVANYLSYKKKYQLPIIGVVKANAYGHGAVLVSKVLEENGITMLAVATLEEAIELRKEQTMIPILVFGSLEISDYAKADLFDLIITLNSLEDIGRYIQSGLYLSAHLKINTGMNRLGVDEKDIMAVKNLIKENKINIQGVFTHYASKEDTIKENILFAKFIQELELQNCFIHTGEAQNVFSGCQAIRVGLGLYGLQQSCEDLSLLPVLSLITPFIRKRKIEPNATVSYHKKYQIQQDGFLYTLPLGYGDGWNKEIRPILQEGEIVGEICMDYMMLYSQVDYAQDHSFSIIGLNNSIIMYSQIFQQSVYQIVTHLNMRLKRKIII